MITNNQFTTILKKLNSKQLEAVNCINGPVVVLAGPGTGKTQVLATRIGNILLHTDMQPQNILCLTYSNAGVDSMKVRLKELLGVTGEEVPVYTYHSFANEIILSSNKKDSFQSMGVLTDAQRYMIIEKLLTNKNIATDFYDMKPPSGFKIKTLSDIFQSFKKEGINRKKLELIAFRIINDIIPFDSDYLKKNNELNKKGTDEIDAIQKFCKSIMTLFEAYCKILEDKKRYEYEDMLEIATDLMKEDANILSGLQERFQYILVDEFQDTNSNQVELLKLLIHNVEQPNIFIVGDDDQCIYKFQGADEDNFNWISNSVANLKTILLDENYRSSQPLLKTTHHFIKENTKRHPLKTSELVSSNQDYSLNTNMPLINVYENEEAEAYDIAKQISDIIVQENPNKTIAVLYRKHSESTLLIKWLNHFNIPFSFNTSKINILKTSLGKCLFNSTQFINIYPLNKKDSDSFFCSLAMHLGQQETLLFSFLTYKSQRLLDISFVDWLVHFQEVNDTPIKNIANNLLQLTTIKDEFINKIHLASLTDTFIELLQEDDSIAYKECFISFVDDFIKDDKEKSLTSLAALLQYYEHYGISIELKKPVTKSNQVILSSIHGSKGLEYNYVFIKGCQNGSWENSRTANGAIAIPATLRLLLKDSDDIQDLRRLMYVGMTRAKTHLQISCNESIKNKTNQTLSCLFKHLTDEIIILNKKENIELPVITSEKYSPIYNNDRLQSLINAKYDALSLSKSGIENFLICENKFFFQNICKIPSPSNETFSFGSFVHKILEKVAANPAIQKDNEALQKMIDYYFPDYEHYILKTHQLHLKNYAFEIIKEYLVRYPLEQVKYCLEENVSTTLSNGVKLNGVIDRYFIIQNEAFVVDYKTGKFINKLVAFEDDLNPGNGYWRQSIIYGYLLREKFNFLNKIDLQFHYIETNKNIIDSPQENTNFEGWMGGLWESIQSKQLSKKCSDNECHYCKNIIK
jgi:DNA helicase-2/ATP-dependent DNA helicase PcrA